MVDPEGVLEGLRHHFPIRPQPYGASERAVGLVIIDAVNGFCTVGAGNLAPPEPDAQVARMVEVTARLARRFAERRKPILAFLDTHEPGKAEPPYPPHCERGTGEENLVPELAWLEACPEATLLRKDCINGWVGAIEPVHTGQHGVFHNRLVGWLGTHRLDAVIVTGICTDICVMDFVLTLLSARNHGLTPWLKDVVVYEPATATFDLPRAAAEAAGLPATSAHPKGPAHHMGLYFMASRGAILASELI
ncbi:isochorismatase family protein [Marinivivus vitaminiproducens]|uniref:isochorismatase family protein n=1 Tax=Marinivivus vitaminiproducens TaxID=3035935 RepID=UPI0027A0E6ED|nr:isochorismatase family protein [Geminicoccaceae bacterium SCSIO 64248]